MSTEKSSIASLRIVTADHYMHEPLAELDPFYSEYRGSSVTKVPVIRIFGTNATGIKQCMHVHGVFPYIYIPYHGQNPKECDRFTYQVAASLDKAINISLGQMNGNAQHVFKIVHVKGIPFYGYHAMEHQYLKIYLYNPMLIKRAASLFQNGAILGKIFQPHESHVPYVLQFLIDYNLYGMSFLYVPSEVVRFRQPFNEHLAGIDENQMLKNAERTSTSKMECDIPAALILNRLEVNTVKSKTEHENPGIASIWRDEVARRSQMETTPSPPTVPLPEDRPDAHSTESENFYLEALKTKIKKLRDLNETDSNESMSMSCLSGSVTHSSGDTKKTFNLKQFLSNSVYPAECSPNDDVLNASHILNHTSQKCGSLDSTLRPNISTAWQMESALDETIVNEDVILSLSQKHSADESLNDEEFELLEIMRKLETNDDKYDRDVDEDSLLAPLSQATENRIQSSQRSNVVSKPMDCEENTAVDEANNKYFMDSDDDLLNDFSFCMEAETVKYCKNNLSIDQLDGASDDVRTPKKIRNKYAPLNIIHCRTPKRDGLDKINEMLKGNREVHVMPISKKPRLASPTATKPLSHEPKSSIIDLTMSDDEDMVRASEQQSDVSFVACRLTKKVSIPQEKPAVLIVEQAKDCLAVQTTTRTPIRKQKQPTETITPSLINPTPPKRPRTSVDLPPFFEKIIQTSPTVKLKKYANLEIDCPTTPPPESSPPAEPSPPQAKRYPTRARINKFKQIVETRVISSTSAKEKKEKKKSLCLDNLSDCEISRNYDKHHNFFPEAGPSTANFYAYVDIPGYYYPVEDISIKSTPKTAKSSVAPDTPESDPEEDPLAIDPISVQSFYGETSGLDSPYQRKNKVYSPPFDINKFNENIGNNDHDTSISTPVMRKIKHRFRGTSSPIPSIDEPITITALLRPPTFDEALSNMFEYDIPMDRPTEPFYGNSDDVTARKEVGNTILDIQSRNNVPDFESGLTGGGLNMWRQKIFDKVTGGKNNKLAQTFNIQHMRDFLSSEQPCVISPVISSPSAIECARWVKSTGRHQLPSASSTLDCLVDSPIRVRREKVKVTLNGGESNDDNDVDCDISISLSPLTTPAASNKTQIMDTILSSQSPVSSVHASGWRRKMHAKLSLSRRFERIRNENTRNINSASTSPNIFAGSLNSAASPKRPPRSNGTHSSSESNDAVICLDEKDDCTPCSQLFNGHSNGGTPKPSTTIDVAKQIWQSASFVTNFNLDVSGYRSPGSGDHSFGISGATLENSYGFKMDLENFQSANATLEHNFLTIMALEIHVQTRGNLRPDPEHDEISCVFYQIQNNVPPENIDHIPITVVGFIVVGEASSNANHSLAAARLRPIIGDNVNVEYATSERDLLLMLVTLVARWDPDIFTGYEIEMASWGYVLQRGQKLDINLSSMFSRIPSQKVRSTWDDEEAGADENSVEFEVKLIGRIFLNVWRLLRGEIALTSYTFESVMYHIIHRRCPLQAHRDLTRMWKRSLTQWIVLEYYLERVNGTMELLSQLDLIGRTCELAKLFGIQFYEVLSRGSQFRVESMMLRIAKPKNVIPVSPSVQQRAHMRSPEYLPLILEPLSRLYTEPLIVLDFQSLYPSIIIGYNYCFSTCLGRVEHLGHSTPFEFGASQLRISPTLLNKLIARDLITISPCGAVFVKSSVREGVLPRMLREILDTRLMVKQSMKMHKADKVLQRVLHSRQLGLKLMANVTYGYTAANFSGRMPCVEVGDSVVSKGRETLERAIKLVEATEKWRAKVVYGDTDSLFVLVPGRSRAEAFKIGAEIADAVTNDNPYPVKLKLEKVYQPSLLQTKKRYVGFMYETPEQEAPTYEAKGIETVRRDGCPAVAKMLEKTLKILFETRDVSAIKTYVCRQFSKILSGRANIQDLIFAKEFRGIKGYKPGACVPALELTRKWRLQDRRAEPRRGERVPYLVVNGPPGVPLIRLVRSPHDYLADPGLKINAIYYITKVIIPPLNRCLLLIGADVRVWFADLPRKLTQLPSVSIASSSVGLTKGAVAKKSTISQYFSTTSCAADCGAQTQLGLCNDCNGVPSRASVMLADKLRRLDRQYVQVTRLCQSCCGRKTDTDCISLDCPVLFVLNDCRRAHEQTQYYRELLNTL